MTEILLLGTFHFMESSIDFYSPESQEEFSILTKKIQRFCPDTIAVEAAKHSQKYIDISYNKFCLEDLKNMDKMICETLGEIYMFGDFYPITYNNEAVQIGYRLGKELSHSNIYAIDDDTILDMTPMQSHTPSLEEARKEWNEIFANEPAEGILEIFKYLNADDWVNANHSLYIQTNSVDIDKDYSGSKMVSKWYERNLKIFSNIQNLSKKSSRLFVLYGAGHLKLLRQFIEADRNLKLVDVYEYL